MQMTAFSSGVPSVLADDTGAFAVSGGAVPPPPRTAGALRLSPGADGEAKEHGQLVALRKQVLHCTFLCAKR